MNNIQISAKFANTSSSNLADFKRVAADALEITKREHGGVLQYDWFFDLVQQAFDESAARAISSCVDEPTSSVAVMAEPSPGGCRRR